MKIRRIGIVGFGHIGKYLYEKIAVSGNQSIYVDFIWNRSKEKLKGLPNDVILEKLEDFEKRDVDLIVEVSHVSITQEYGERFLEKADFMIGSPTALADRLLYGKLSKSANIHGHGLYVPAGAFWGGDDVRKMANLGTLKGLTVTMKKHPASFRLDGYLADKNKNVGDEPVVLYRGSVRELCPLAPANVNTMACAAIAATNLGFDQVIGCLVADKSLTSHVIEIEVNGPSSSNENGESFTVKTVRNNPCAPGAVTGNATYDSFLQSVLGAHSKGAGIHLC